ncbi:MAG: stalk domain-containing protein [Solirubrobacterales bacterium]
MRKKMIAVVLISLTVVLFACSAFALQPIQLWINGKQVVTEQTPILQNGRVYVPIRVVADNMNATVGWSAADRKVDIRTATPTSPAIPAAPATSVKYRLLKLNGEQTAWPCWYENNVLYMQYLDVLTLLRMVTPHPSYVVYYMKETGSFGINDAKYEMPYVLKDGLKAIPLTTLKDKGQLTYEFDPATDNLKIKLPL